MKTNKELSLEEAMQKIQDENQENFMSKIYENIKWLNEKANMKGYKSTFKERLMFNQIVTIIKDMDKWF